MPKYPMLVGPHDTRGPLSQINNPSNGFAGHFYYATDTDKWYYNNGMAWNEIPLDIPDLPPQVITGAGLPQLVASIQLAINNIVNDNNALKEALRKTGSLEP